MNSRNPGLMDSGLVVSGMWVSAFNRYRGFGLLELNSGFQSQGIRNPGNLKLGRKSISSPLFLQIASFAASDLSPRRVGNSSRANRI